MSSTSSCQLRQLFFPVAFCLQQKGRSLSCSDWHPEALIPRHRHWRCLSTAACMEPKVMDVLLLLQKSKRIWWSQRILQQWETSQCKPAHFLKMRESLNLAPLVNAAFGCTSQAQHPCPAQQAPSFYLCIISSSWKASLPFCATFPSSGLSSPGAPSLQRSCTAATPGRMWKARRGVRSRGPHCRGWKKSLEM